MGAGEATRDERVNIICEGPEIEGILWPRGATLAARLNLGLHCTDPCISDKALSHNYFLSVFESTLAVCSVCNRAGAKGIFSGDSVKNLIRLFLC